MFRDTIAYPRLLKRLRCIRCEAFYNFVKHAIAPNYDDPIPPTYRATLCLCYHVTCMPRILRVHHFHLHVAALHQGGHLILERWHRLLLPTHGVHNDQQLLRPLWLCLGNAALHARCAADRKPDYFEAQMLLARVEQEQGNLPTAIRAAEAATQLDPKSSTAWVLKAEIESQQNKLALAAASMKKAADLVGRSAPLYRKAADLAEAAQDAQTAAALRARADELAPPPK